MKRVGSRLGLLSLGAAAALVVAVTFAIFAYVLAQGAPVLSVEFLLSAPRSGMTEGGILPAALGTAYVTVVTAVASVPVGVLAAAYLHEYAPSGPVTAAIRLSIRNLSGVPSIVYGLFGVALFVHGLGLGLSILSSGLTLGLLTLPWTITASEEAFRAVPPGYRDGALALGATRWEALSRVVVPAAAPGILTGVILGLARAAGETAPILFTGVSFSRPALPSAPTDRFMALPYHLYVLATQHHDPAAVRPIAHGTALVLLLLVVVMSLGAADLRRRLRSEQNG